MSDAMRYLLHAACQPYRAADRFAWHFAKGKLRHDPAFKGILAHGLLPNDNHAIRVLDIGCGQGLLAAWLLAAQAQYAEGKWWPKDWPAPPTIGHVHGIELMPRDVERAQAALKSHTLHTSFRLADMCEADFPASDAVVILDVLHYVDFPAQKEVLRKVHACLTHHGVLLLRVGDASAGWPFVFSNWVDKMVTALRGHRHPPIFCRPLSDWQRTLEQIGFATYTMPMHQGTPFANILLVCHKYHAQAAP